MVFVIMFCLVLCGARNCDSGLVNNGGTITVGDYQTSFSLAAGGIVCLHSSVVSPSLSTFSTTNFAWSIQPSSPIASNSRLFTGEVPVGNQNGNCNNFADRGNLIVGSPAPYALGKYGPVTISPGNKPSIKLQCTNTVFSCTFPSSWLETCWIQSEPTTSSIGAATGASTSGTPAPTVATLYSGYYYVTVNRNCTVDLCGACLDSSITQLEMTHPAGAVETIDSPYADARINIMPNYTASFFGVPYQVSKNDQTYTLYRGPTVCRVTLSCFDGECARWAISTATTTRNAATTRTATTTRPSGAALSAQSSFFVATVAIGIALMI